MISMEICVEPHPSHQTFNVFTDVFYKLLKSTLWAQYDPKIGMFRSNCLKVYGMSISYQVLFRQYILQIYGHTRTHFQLFYGKNVIVGRK